MLKVVRMLASNAALIFLLFVSGFARAADSPLSKLASARFANLTRAERALLEFADLMTRAPGDFAAGGTSADPSDPSNDPTHADKWPRDRTVRAELIRWMCVDPDALRHIDPRGIRLTGARIDGKLNLSYVHVPFGFACVRCSIPEVLELHSTEIVSLDLNASRTNQIYAPSLYVHGAAYFGWDEHDWGNWFEASGEITLGNARIDGPLNFGSGIFHGSKHPASAEVPDAAIDLSSAVLANQLSLCCGLVAHGKVLMDRASIGESIYMSGGHFLNPGDIAVSGISVRVAGDVYMNAAPFSGDVEADGLVQFPAAHVGGLVWVDHAHFKGASGTLHGLSLKNTTMGTFGWQHVDLQNSAELDLTGATADNMIDDEPSWPTPGNLIIEGFSYRALGPTIDASSRLRWLARQPTGYHSQSYRELAKFLRESGDDAGATQVMIASGDARYSRHGLPGRLLGWLLKVTIGYGHRPMLALLWSLGVVLVGWAAVFVGKRAGVMAPTWPENKPPDARKSYEELQPLLYSLDAFLPFVNLHQEHYWWPDATVTGECAVLGSKITVRGRALRYYLWLQIVAGWLLSAIFVAGITGLLRND